MKRLVGSLFLPFGVSMAVALFGCGESRNVGDDIDWLNDVRPIVTANCVRCHTVPALDGAPNTFRLDVWDETLDAQGGVILGAGQMAEFMALSTSQGNMPPRFELSGEDKTTIERWYKSRDVGNAPPKGIGRMDNHPPSATLYGLPAVDDDGLLSIGYEVSDLDQELVYGSLSLSRMGALSKVLTHLLHGGRGRVVADVGGMAEGTYDIVVELNDGHESAVQTIGELNISHVGANPKPVATFERDYRESLFTDFDGSDASHSLFVSDDGDDVLNVRVGLESRTNQIELLNEDVSSGSEVDFVLDVSEADEGNDWYVVARVTDSSRTSTTRSGPFSIRRGEATALSFEAEPAVDNPAELTVARVFESCVSCHPGSSSDGSSRIPGLGFDVRDYEDAYNMRGKIFRRVVLSKTMPPQSIGSLGQEQLSVLEKWLLGGAPR